MTYDEACALIASLMNERFAINPDARPFTAEGVAIELDGVEWDPDLDWLRQRYPYLAMEILTRAGAVEDALPRVLGEIGVVIGRLGALSAEDLAAGWDNSHAQAWITTLEETRAELGRPTSSPRDLWIVGAVARALDHDGLTESALAGALFSIAHQISTLPESRDRTTLRREGRSQAGRKGT